MTRTIYLVRHGQAAAGWNEDPDPGLSETGWQQASAVDAFFAPGPVRPIITSPLRRARETARPLSQRWGLTPAVDTAFAEIPAPAGYSLSQRMQWLLAMRDQSWPGCGKELHEWRGRILQQLQQLPDQAIVFTHFMVMNAVVGAATGNDALVCYQPDNGSILQLQLRPETIDIADWGSQSGTRVL